MTARAGGPRIHLALTRLREDAEPWVAPLARGGITCSLHPCIAIAPIENPKMLAEVTRELEKTTHIAVSSRHAARILRRVFYEKGVRLSQDIAFVAVGPATARALAWTGASVREAAPACAEGLLAHLLEETRAGRDHVLLPSAKNGRRLVFEQLHAAKISVRFWPLYETRALRLTDAPLTLPAETTHVLFSSPSQVAGFIARRSWSPRWQAMSFGPSTTRALEAAHIPCALEAPYPTLEAVMALLKRDAL